MIVSRAPTRISLGGGGTDLKSYYSKHGGFLIAGAIDKYCNILAQWRFEENIRLSYSKTEIVDNVADIEHRIFRAALEFTGVKSNIELHSSADVPASCGLGTSSSFTVALLNALHAYKKEFITREQLAEEACHIEIDVLGEPIGKQDQYIAAFGGVTCLTFEKDGHVIVEPLRVHPEVLDRLETNSVMFFTGIQRSASAILSEQDKKCQQNDAEMERNLDQIKEIGLATRRYLENGQVDMLGELFHVHWETKKKRSKSMSDPFIDECYEIARKNGAVGGKLIGAGGGGFFMFYCYNLNHEKPRLIEAMQNVGLRWTKFRFDLDGTKILVNA
jgi:D-glycero-alpha-D-manno-heptose-7-phosphate kinase